MPNFHLSPPVQFGTLCDVEDADGAWVSREDWTPEMVEAVMAEAHERMAAMQQDLTDLSARRAA